MLFVPGVGKANTFQEGVFRSRDAIRAEGQDQHWNQSVFKHGINFVENLSIDQILRC